ncbi:minor tail protein [Gordonia phage Ruthy]|uniref:Minor tail protein n=1 Tax=Gordonia phage Ruthy TaxID=2250323 RepID=A0A345L5D2_9CAUD|nr:minor tail protein [Gordonia phage Ruthy]AXH50484.1 minor tail protein [Gordonia phage Ruthy]
MTVLPDEPVHIGDRTVRLRFYAIPRKPGDPQTVVGTLTLEDSEGVLTLDALQGDKGDKGTPSPIIRPQWAHGYSTSSALYAGENTLGAPDAGRAWYIGGFWYVWTGTAWRQEQGSLPGPPGPTPDVSMTAELVEPAESGPYGEVEIEVSGPDSSPHFHLKIPGIEGPQGDNSTIIGASDYDNTSAPLDGQGIVWDSAASKFKPGDLSPYAATMYTIPQNAFAGGSYSAGEQIIAQLVIPAAPVAWYPDVMGHVRWRRSAIGSAQVQIEVRIEAVTGSPSVPGSAPIVGLGPYDPSTLDTTTVSHIAPHFSSDADPGRAVSPTSEVGRIPANQAVTVWVIARRTGGSGSYTIDASWSQLAIRCYPVS